MTKPNLEKEIEQRFNEPLLPIEKKLIAWSLGIGLASLILLALISRFLPVN